MNTAWIIISFLSGCVLGVLYFGGLWLTVRRATIARQPGLLLFLSFLVRTAVTLFGFYLVMDGRWERLIACLIGFVVARALLIRRLGDADEASDPSSLPANTRSSIG
ncbi:MAG: ATP synthase subunit I [Planctomycetota bacterium]|nr:MAG: ATP synthase subunit I [Planctomycetota bacterium]REJ89711.1 MAG: ATP synthase subunit I [Planctomycetota bacterium]REK26645.1 MAG: ATP synthase subunit I [Planctomycetota bacterium]REK47327.1 MAG: ATP synthase subunit I [Planctomycetota bacterium]